MRRLTDNVHFVTELWGNKTVAVESKFCHNSTHPSHSFFLEIRVDRIVKLHAPIDAGDTVTIDAIQVVPASSVHLQVEKVQLTPMMKLYIASSLGTFVFVHVLSIS